MAVMVERLFKSAVIAFGVFCAVYISLVVAYLAWFFIWGGTHGAEAVPIILTAIPYAFGACIFAAVFAFCWLGRLESNSN
jgi:hypothetical protein